MAELLTSLDVVNQSFKKSMRGYDAAEVDEFLDQIAETLQVYAQKSKDLERELMAKSESLSEYGKIKDALQDTLVMAQQVADEKVRSAETEAKKIIEAAMEKADAICHEASLETERLRDGVSDIRNIRIQYEQEFRGILAKFDNLLNQTISHSPLDVSVDTLLAGVHHAEEDGEGSNVEGTRVREVETGDGWLERDQNRPSAYSGAGRPEDGGY